MHIAVLLQEAVDALAIKPDGVYVDGTFGRGGHSAEIFKRLGKAGQLIAIDRDPQAVTAGQQLSEEWRARASETGAKKARCPKARIIATPCFWL